MAEPKIPSLDDFAEAEHCVLEDVTVQHPALTDDYIERRKANREIRDIVDINDKLRGRQTVIRFFADGWIDIKVERRGRQPSRHRIDMQFLDPVPAMRRYHPIRLLKASAILGAITAVFAVPASLGWITNYSIPATLIAAAATLCTLFVAFYLTHEKIVFKTLHGRANAIRFGAGLGTIRKFHKLVPKLVDAIADAAESVNDETAVYLRAEMREHYRLRSDGIISEAECADCTGRILGSFDGPL